MLLHLFLPCFSMTRRSPYALFCPTPLLPSAIAEAEAEDEPVAPLRTEEAQAGVKPRERMGQHLYPTLNSDSSAWFDELKEVGEAEVDSDDECEYDYGGYDASYDTLSVDELSEASSTVETDSAISGAGFVSEGDYLAAPATIDALGAAAAESPAFAQDPVQRSNSVPLDIFVSAAATASVPTRSPPPPPRPPRAATLTQLLPSGAGAAAEDHTSAPARPAAPPPGSPQRHTSLPPVALASQAGLVSSSQSQQEQVVPLSLVAAVPPPRPPPLSPGLSPSVKRHSYGEQQQPGAAQPVGSSALLLTNVPMSGTSLALGGKSPPPVRPAKGPTTDLASKRSSGGDMGSFVNTPPARPQSLPRGLRPMSDVEVCKG